jgi:NAD(P)-dependent dehydrogenase (short-subunit alcohol dehydrogenase family)
VRITESCAGFAAEGIRVNAVLPGMVDTDMTHKHTGDGTRPARWLEPIIAATPLLSADDIAAAVLELVRDDTAVAVSKVVSNPKPSPSRRFSPPERARRWAHTEEAGCAERTYEAASLA